MSYLFRDETTNAIKRLRITNAVASYAYLTSPRPETSQFRAGQYCTELIIKDEETVTLIKQYVKEIAKVAIAEDWGGVMPQNLKLPYHAGDEDNEREAGFVILETGSPKFQPKLLIRDPRTGRASELTEDQVDDYYSGMYVDADVTFRPYQVGKNVGIKAYLNTVCKVADGTPFAAGFALEDSFSIELDNPEEDSFDAIPAKPAAKKPNKKVEQPTEDTMDLDDLINGTPAKPAANKTTAPKKTTQQAEPQMTIDDLLNL